MPLLYKLSYLCHKKIKVLINMTQRFNERPVLNLHNEVYLQNYLIKEYNFKKG